jgi:hypothetical protein
VARGAKGSHPHIREQIRDGGRISYQVHPKVFWPDGTIRHHYAGTYDTLEDAEKARDESLAKLRAERDAERKRIADATETEWQAEGLTAVAEPDEADVWERACAAWSESAEIERRRQRQTLTFPGPVVTLAFLADQHIGGEGVDYPRLRDEAQLIRETPGMYAATVGDLLDNMIAGKLLAVRMGTTLSIPKEVTLAKLYLEILAPKLVAAVAGNHEHWTRSLAGIDYFAEVLASATSRCLYDPHDCRITVRVGSCERRVRMRHKWRGNSYLNALHGIMRASREDQDFDIGVGAHTHASGLAGTFTTGGQTRLALLCGTYKRADDYARSGGFAKPNNSTAVCAMINGRDGTMVGIESLDEAARLTRLALVDAERRVFAVEHSPQG